MIAINGTPNALVCPGTTVRGVLDLLGIDADARGLAVALDGEVVPRHAWATAVLGQDARVEVLTAVQGG